MPFERRVFATCFRVVQRVIDAGRSAPVAGPAAGEHADVRLDAEPSHQPGAEYSQLDLIIHRPALVDAHGREEEEPAVRRLEQRDAHDLLQSHGRFQVLERLAGAQRATYDSVHFPGFEKIDEHGLRVVGSDDRKTRAQPFLADQRHVGIAFRGRVLSARHGLVDIFAAHAQGNAGAIGACASDDGIPERGVPDRRHHFLISGRALSL